MERDFLEKHFPYAFYSDNPEFVKRYSYLDENRAANLDSLVEHYSQGNNYGPTIGCLPFSENENYLIKEFLLRIEKYALKVRKLLKSA